MGNGGTLENMINLTCVVQLASITVSRCKRQYSIRWHPQQKHSLVESNFLNRQDDRHHQDWREIIVGGGGVLGRGGGKYTITLVFCQFQIYHKKRRSISHSFVAIRATK